MHPIAIKWARADARQDAINQLGAGAEKAIREAALELEALYPQYRGWTERSTFGIAAKNWYKSGRYYMKAGDRVLYQRRGDGKLSVFTVRDGGYLVATPQHVR